MLQEGYDRIGRTEFYRLLRIMKRFDVTTSNWGMSRSTGFGYIQHIGYVIEADSMLWLVTLTDYTNSRTQSGWRVNATPLYYGCSAP